MSRRKMYNINKQLTPYYNCLWNELYYEMFCYIELCETKFCNTTNNQWHALQHCLTNELELLLKTVSKR